MARELLLLSFAALAIAGLAAGASAREVPPNIRAIVEKTRSFGLRGYPISFWNYTNLAEHGKYMDEAEVEEWADAGFTVPQSPNFDASDPRQKAHVLKLLDWAWARGMKLILCDSRTYAKAGPGGEGGLVPPDYQEGVRAAVADFGHHPGLFGFHVGDEPGKDFKYAFAECYRIQKKVAPRLHPFANHLPWWPGAETVVGNASWAEYLDEFVRLSNADLLSYDCYAQMNPGQGGWHMYFANLREYRAASLRNGIPFWNTILSVGHFRYRCPTFDELRWQFNTSLCCGANGILWFFYYMRQPHSNYRLSPVDEHWDRTQTYYDIRRIQKSFHRHYGDLFTRLVSTRVTFYPMPFGGGQSFTPNGIISRVQPDAENHPILIGEFTDDQGRPYVMIVNNSMTDSVFVRVTFPGKDVKVYSWDWSGREREGGAYCTDELKRTDDGLTAGQWLAPGQEALFRIESSSAEQEPIPRE